MLAKVALAAGAVALVLVVRLVVTSVWWRLADRSVSPDGRRSGRRATGRAEGRVIRLDEAE